MRIGLNATCFNERPSGANQRFRGIYGSMIRRHSDVEFVVYEPVDQRVADWFGGASNVTVCRTPIPSVGRLSRVGAGLNFWRRRLRKDKLNSFEAFNLPLVRAPNCPTILTIHDLRSILSDAPALSRAVFKPVLRHAFANADHVIAVSAAIADEIKNFYPSVRVSTVYNGVDPSCSIAPPSDDVAAVRQRYGIAQDYILTVGHLEPRKNLLVLIDAVALLRDRGKQRTLVIVGNNGGERQAIRARISEARLDNQILVIENADNASLRLLYSGCEMLVFPSRYEGFGIPILEAMAASKPMVLADTPVFRELTLGQGTYFPVDDASTAADSIERLSNDPCEQKRQIRFGIERLRDFDFDCLADQILALHRIHAS